jgi:RNA polymerase sigma-70 factor (ECF subfamily)
MIDPYRDSWRAWPPSPASVDAARDGDTASMHSILAAGIPKLVAFYRGLGLSVSDAEDAAADACEAVVKYLPRLRDPVTFEAWFWKVARNKFHDYLRRKQRPDPKPDSGLALGIPEEGLILQADHEAVRRAFEQLRLRDRELLWMRDVVGLRYADMAGRLRLSEGSIRIAVMRARRRLEQELGELENALEA